MTVKVSEFKTYEGTEKNGIGGNSVDTSAADCFVTITGNIVTKATSSTPIAGVSLTRAAFAADNETVAAATLGYMPKEMRNTYAVTITGGTVTAADEGKFYNLSDSVTVDGTTESAVGFYIDTTSAAAVDEVIVYQLQLVKFVSATNSIFRINSLV